MLKLFGIRCFTAVILPGMKNAKSSPAFNNLLHDLTSG